MSGHDREARGRSFRYYDLILGAFVAALIVSNLLAPKVVSVGGWTFGAGVLFFPITYLFGDILTEVYGYARSRRVVWAGFAALLGTSLATWIVLALPPAPSWKDQRAFEAVLGGVPRVILGSMVGFFAGEFVNAYTLARLKVATRGRWLWVRTIGSTVLGEAADSLLFYPIAFLGVWDSTTLGIVIGTNYALKVFWEVLATPLTYGVVGYLKRAEDEDYYDLGTDFTPFSLRA